jgi:hypothetical protein
MRAFWSELTQAIATAPKSVIPRPASAPSMTGPKKNAPPPVPQKRAAQHVPSPPSYDRVSTTAEVAPAVSPPSSPVLPIASPFEAAPYSEDLPDEELLAPAGLDPSPVARRLAAIGKTPRQQRWLAAGGAGALAGIVILLAVTAPRATGGPREGRVVTSHAAKLRVEPKEVRAPGPMQLPADVVPSPPPPVVPAAIPQTPGRFSAAGARAALAEASPDLVECKTTPGPRGPGSVRVRFNPSGKMAEAYLGPPYANTATGRCILERFSNVRVEPYEGGIPMAVNHVFYSITY